MATVVVGEEGELAEVLEQALGVGDSLWVGAVVSLPPLGSDDHPDDPARVPQEAIRQAARRCQAAALLVAGRPGHRTMAALGEVAITLGCRLLVLAPAAPATGMAPTVVRVRGVPVIEMLPPRVPRLSLEVKRGVDMVVAAAALVVSAPLLAILAVAIRLESAGSPLFGHERVGVGGRRFRCWKLRTMHVTAQQRLAQEPALRAAYVANGYKLPDTQDPRITRLGRWLRRSSLDELPQLWNVLAGDMSLVGPRPVVADELAHYKGTTLELLSVRPGMTGAWAVSGRHDVGYPERARIELAYVRHHTLMGDLRIVLGTVKAVLHPGGE